MRVSIVTPSYNQAQFLEKTILSVLDHKKIDLEYILIDGGSNDGSVEIIQRYADKFAYWVSESDKGQADAVNKGFARATGDIIGWLNSDDYYLPGAIDSAVDIFEKNPDVGFIFGDMISIDGEGQTINVQRFGDWGLLGLMSFNIIGEPAVFLRREVMEKSGFLDDSFHFLLDHHLWLRAAQHTKMMYVPKLWAAARYHEDAKNIAYADRFGEEAFRIIKWMENEPKLSALFIANKNQILSGAHRLNGYYLSIGEKWCQSLKAYWKSFRYYPSTAIKDWKRILFTLSSSLGLIKIGKIFTILNRQRKQQKIKRH
jgi:glycosyltransferase involved in cell wall biosynthesis